MFFSSFSLPNHLMSICLWGHVQMLSQLLKGLPMLSTHTAIFPLPSLWEPTEQFLCTHSISRLLYMLFPWNAVGSSPVKILLIL